MRGAWGGPGLGCRAEGGGVGAGGLGGPCVSVCPWGRRATDAGVKLHKKKKKKVLQLLFYGLLHIAQGFGVR